MRTRPCSVQALAPWASQGNRPALCLRGISPLGFSAALAALPILRVIAREVIYAFSGRAFNLCGTSVMGFMSTLAAQFYLHGTYPTGFRKFLAMQIQSLSKQ